MTDPEDTTRLLPSDLAETEVDEADEFERPVPLEANDADVVEQKLEVPVEDDDYWDE
jgi:hypothetical protein